MSVYFNIDYCRNLHSNKKKWQASPFTSWSPLSQRILCVFPSSLFISFPSSNLKDLTESAFLKEMKSVHSTSNTWKHSTVSQGPARTPHRLENLFLIFLVASAHTDLYSSWAYVNNAFRTTSLALKLGKIISGFWLWGLLCSPIGS